jgi:hypothetical protein
MVPPGRSTGDRMRQRSWLAGGGGGEEQPAALVRRGGRAGEAVSRERAVIQIARVESELSAREPRRLLPGV